MSAHYKQKLLNFIFTVRHLIAAICACLALLIINKVTILLFIMPPLPLDFFTVANLLWQTNEWFFQAVCLFNYIVKPLFVYFIVIFLIYLLHQRTAKPEA